MLKRIIIAIAGCFVLIGLACARVDANRADSAALESVKDIDPTPVFTASNKHVKGPPQKTDGDHGPSKTLLLLVRLIAKLS